MIHAFSIILASSIGSFFGTIIGWHIGEFAWKINKKVNRR